MPTRRFSRRIWLTAHHSSDQVLGAQTMLAHGGNNLNDCCFSLCQPKLMLALTFPDLPALLVAIVGLGEGGPHLTHQLTKALVSHWHIGKTAIGLKDFPFSKTLVFKWHLRGYPRSRRSIFHHSPPMAIRRPLCCRKTDHSMVTDAVSPPSPKISRPRIAPMRYLRRQVVRWGAWKENFCAMYFAEFSMYGNTVLSLMFS